MNSELKKEHLYESVKRLVEGEADHVHLDQHKLFTLYSVAFQYMLYMSTKNPGAYLIRLEDAHLADKLTRKAKDRESRNFLDKMLLPRRIKFGKSTFYLDYFQISTWSQTNDVPDDKWRAALIVKNTSSKPMEGEIEEEGEEIKVSETFKGEQIFSDKYFYINTIKEFIPKTITIAYEEEIPGSRPVQFDFHRQRRSSSRWRETRQRHLS